MAHPTRFIRPEDLQFPLQFFAPMLTPYWKELSDRNGDNNTATSQEDSTEASEAHRSIVPPSMISPTTSSNEVCTAIVPVSTTSPNEVPIEVSNDVFNSSISSYKGDLRNPNNHSAPIPTTMSTSVFISELSPKSTIHDVLSEIRDCGKIWASNIVPAQRDYITAAAKVVFWDRTGLERFLQRWIDGNFIVGGRRPKVVMNDYHSAPKGPSTASRVVQVSGPSGIVNEQYLRQFFSANFKYDIDEVIILFADSEADTVALEIRFASYRAQAATAFKRINDACRGGHVPNIVMSEMERFMWRGVSVAYGRDPCEW
ncbi:hypothetical protein F5X99DRAFT_423386 [Biscogniauxia marginata]|nr:hypothetical protein F5X99DRAFT_423386 [Biscogniauxia marginata]